jgi:hypothetical protein
MTSQEITVQELPNVHRRINNPERLESIFQDYQNHIYTVSDRYPPVRLEEEELWTATVHDRSWLFRHHSLVSLAYLIDSYYVDKNTQKVYLALEIAGKWFNANYPQSPSVMGWHDHSTALRLLHIVKLYLVISELEDQESLNNLEMLAEKHMEKLADPEFYMPKHNHGLDQDMILYLASSVLKNLPNSLKWIDLAIMRFWQQVNHLFAEDGSYLEHSPRYIYILLERLLNFQKILMKVDEREGTALKEKIIKVTRFFIYSLHPDGTSPTIGDTELISFNLNRDRWEIIPEDLYNILESIKKVNDVKITLPLDAFYQDGGYAFFRSDWANNEQTTQLIFYSAFHSRVHKHHDDLSILIYGHGKPLLIDAGKFSYQYDREERQYVTSSYGHNTVRINDSETDLARLNINKSGLLSYLNTKNIGYASGFHTLVKGTTHRRMIFYFKPGEVIILDRVKSNRRINNEIIFNLHSDLISTKVDNKIIGYFEGKPEIFIENLLGDSNYTKLRGQTNPLKGWSSDFYGEFKANDMISMKENGHVVKFATLIHLNDNTSVKEFKWNQDEVYFKWRSFDIRLKLTDFYELLEINGKIYDTQKVFQNPILFEAITNNESAFYKSYRFEDYLNK